MFSRMKIVTLAVLFAGVGVASAADDTKAADQPFDDVMFVKMAASGGLHEVELGKVASEKAMSAEVKRFGGQMVKDHSKANEDLKAAAKAANISVPEQMNEKHQKHVETFKNYSGENFDADYMKHMVESHTESVALFTRASKEAKNPQLKEFATKTLPVIQQHLEMAKKHVN